MLFEQNGHRVNVIVEDMVVEAMQTEQVVAKIVRTNQPIFTKKLGIRKLPMLTKLGKDFVQAARRGLGEVRQEFPFHTFHPLLELFEKHTYDLPEGHLPICPADVQLLNQRVANLREEARSVAFRSKRDRYIKTCRKNQVGLEKLIDALFVRHSRLLVVRLEVGYRQAWCFPFQKGREAVTPQQADIHRKTFLRSMRRDKEHPLLGYAGAMELGSRKWLHYHWVFFFDGDRLRSDIAIAQILGERWRKVTQDEGTYWNCNADFYVDRGIGSIRYDSSEGLRALKKFVATYLTKADYYIRLVAPNQRKFFRGVMPKPKLHKRGRPRKAAILSGEIQPDAFMALV